MCESNFVVEILGFPKIFVYILMGKGWGGVMKANLEKEKKKLHFYFVWLA